MTTSLQLPNNRILNLAIFFLCVITIAIVLYMEHVMLLSPCGLCITQRVFVVLCGFVCLASAIHNPAHKGQQIYAFTGASMCVFGSYFAIRQIWMQQLPEELVPACGPGLSYLYENFPLIETLNFLLKGDGNCAEVGWQFLGILSIPQLALIAFTVLFASCLYIAFRKPTAAY
jgi:protein dithiol:quinone oxidoreductase